MKKRDSSRSYSKFLEITVEIFFTPNVRIDKGNQMHFCAETEYFLWHSFCTARIGRISAPRELADGNVVHVRVDCAISRRR